MSKPGLGPRRRGTVLAIAWLSLFVGVEAVPADPGGVPKIRGARIVLVVDDFGYAYNETVRGFLAVPEAITISVIPLEYYSYRIAAEAEESGKEVMAHIPMEPLAYPEKDPGSGALLVDHSDDEIRRLVRQALDSYPNFDGANNHMGSRVMQEQRIVSIVMEEIARRDLFFVDSKTYPGNLARSVARTLGVRFAENRMFWDDGYSTSEEILDNLDRLARMALEQGWAIGIGHPRGIALDALRKKLPEFKKLGIQIVPMTDLVGQPG